MTEPHPRQDDPTAGLPDDLARLLRDPSIIVPQDQAVFEAIADVGDRGVIGRRPVRIDEDPSA